MEHMQSPSRPLRAATRRARQQQLKRRFFQDCSLRGAAAAEPAEVARRAFRGLTRAYSGGGGLPS